MDSIQIFNTNDMPNIHKRVTAQKAVEKSKRKKNHIALLQEKKGEGKTGNLETYAKSEKDIVTNHAVNYN